MKNKHQGFIVPLLIIIIAALAIGGGVYIAKNKGKKQEVLPQVNIPTEVSTQTSISNSTNKKPSPIKVISPINGDAGYIGNYLRIAWVPTSTKVNVYLEKFDQKGNQIGDSKPLVEAIDNTGEYGWVPASSLSTTYKYKIKITKANDLNGDASDSGESSGFFTLSPNEHF